MESSQDINALPFSAEWNIHRMPIDDESGCQRRDAGEGDKDKVANSQSKASKESEFGSFVVWIVNWIWLLRLRL